MHIFITLLHSVDITFAINCSTIALIYLHGNAKDERKEVHEGQTWSHLPLQEHGRMVMVAILSCDIVLMGCTHLVVHDDHVHHHAHHRHTGN